MLAGANESASRVRVMQRRVRSVRVKPIGDIDDVESALANGM